MKKVNFDFKSLLLFETIYYAVFLLLGVIIYFKSDMTNKTAAILIATFLIAKGIISILEALNKKRFCLFKYSIFLGFLDIILAILMITNPFKMLNCIGWFLGLYIIIEALNKFVLFLKLKKAQEKYANIIAVSSLIAILMGILIIINPFVFLAVTSIAGVFIILDSILSLSDLMLLKKHSNKVLKLK